MALNMTVVTTSGVSVTEVPEDIAKDLEEAYETLSALQVNRAITVDFPDAKAARLFVKQGKAWAAAHDPVLVFSRRGDVKTMPERVTFRVYTPRPGKDDE
jgi:hypothetical protein